MGRHAGLAPAFRAILRACLQDRDDAAVRAGRHLARCRSATGADPQYGERLSIPRYVPTSPPQGDTGAVKEAARLLADAQNPVIVVDRAARSENGVRLLVQLAEALQAQVIDQGGRMNFPKTHYLSRPPTAVNNADVIIGLELTDFWATVNAWIDNGEHGIGINTTRIT